MFHCIMQIPLYHLSKMILFFNYNKDINFIPVFVERLCHE